ncbi:Uncharacterised protein [uncultured archaeon]|nr:Uncharacterised protein [uncultured archaeon]
MTRCRDIIELLSKQAMTLRELAEWFHADTKELLIDLEHISQIIKPGKLVMDPSVCRTCGYVFKDRENRRRPSKCPKCKAEKVSEPVFSIEI